MKKKFILLCLCISASIASSEENQLDKGNTVKLVEATKEEINEVFGSLNDQQNQLIKTFAFSILEKLKDLLQSQDAEEISVIFKNLGYYPQLMLSITLMKPQQDESEKNSSDATLPLV